MQWRGVTSGFVMNLDAPHNVCLVFSEKGMNFPLLLSPSQQQITKMRAANWCEKNAHKNDKHDYLGEGSKCFCAPPNCKFGRKKITAYKNSVQRSLSVEIERQRVLVALLYVIDQFAPLFYARSVGHSIQDIYSDWQLLPKHLRVVIHLPLISQFLYTEIPGTDPRFKPQWLISEHLLILSLLILVSDCSRYSWQRIATKKKFCLGVSYMEHSFAVSLF